MAYSCYTRYEGRGIVDVQPTVTLRFDEMTAVTRNRVRRMFENNVCVYGWSSKPHAVYSALQGHYDLLDSLFHPDVMNHPDFELEEFRARMLLLDHKFDIFGHGRGWRRGYGQLRLDALSMSSERREQLIGAAREVTINLLSPIARKLIDHAKLAPIMKALDNREPYSFEGVSPR